MSSPFAVLTCSALAIFLALLPEGNDPTPSEDPHDPYRPVKRSKPSQISGPANAVIDRLVQAQLDPVHLKLNPEASRSTLIRRVCFDLTGLPPTLSEIETFEQDNQPDAYLRMLDRYLASPTYGERWGKYWLDAAGYADSNGYFNADSDRPLAYHYRDYVIRSFNADKPYDRFVLEQIAGDELVGYRPDGDVTPEMVDPLIATHFLRNAPDGTGESDGNPDEVRTDRLTVLEGNLQNLMNCLTGLTIQCARCHDHKFEPISQEEYYSLQAILFPVYNPDRWVKPNDRSIALGTRKERQSIQQTTEQIDASIRWLRTGKKTIELSLAFFRTVHHLTLIPEETRREIIAAGAVSSDRRSTAQKELLKKYSLTLTREKENDNLLPGYRAWQTKIQDSLTRLEKSRPAAVPTIAAFYETDPQPPTHHLLKRGLHNKPGPEVQPGVPQILTSPSNRYQIGATPAGCISSQRRTALARWLISQENPLLARVMVNRIWAHHFGTGIVATVDNLGTSGARPTHPKLLEFLADYFIDHGWSIKAMHRLIMTSAVYRQQSTSSADRVQVDPANRLLARFPLRRLDAEAIRDGQLFLSGELDFQQFGPYVPSHRTSEGVVDVAGQTPGSRRRSVYIQQRRTQVVTFLQLFDAPAMVATCGRRVSSTVPLQSLAFLNSDFARQRARAFAQRLQRESAQSPNQRLDLAWKLLSARLPTMAERQLCEQFIDQQKDAYAGKPDADIRIWADLCQMLLASNAFLYVE